MIRKKRLIMNTALLTGSSLIMSLISMSFQVWLAGRIGSAGIGLYQLVVSVSFLCTTFAISGVRFAASTVLRNQPLKSPKLDTALNRAYCFAMLLKICCTRSSEISAGASAPVAVSTTRSSARWASLLIGPLSHGRRKKRRACFHSVKNGGDFRRVP